MKLRSFIALAVLLSVTRGIDAQAHNSNTLRGAVVDADGTMVERFTMVVRPVANKPVLVERKHFANGIFVLPALEQQKYEIVISAPKYITSYIEVDFPKNSSSTTLKLVILHRLLTGKYFPGDPAGFESRHLDQLAPEIARESYTRGVSLYRDGKLEEALAAYASAMRLAPQYVSPVVGVGIIYLLLNRPDAGLLYLQRANEMAPKDTVIRLNIALGLLIKSDFRGATKLLESVVHESPEKSMPCLLLARAYFLQKKYAAAQKMVLSALQQDPDLIEARQLLWNIALEKKDYTAARENLAKIRDTLNNEEFSNFVDDQMSQLVSVAR